MPSTTITLSSGVSYAPYGTLTVTETGTSAASNSSTVSAVLVLHRPYEVISSATKSASMTINGTTYSWSGTIGGTGDMTLISKSITIPHNSDGSKSINISASITLQITWSGTYIDKISNSGSLTLTKLELYPTCSISNTSKTETSMVIKWTSDKTIDYVWYSRNGGSSWTAVGSANATSGSVTISSLSANTAYSIKIRVRSKASQLTKDSSELSVTTYAYPYANSMPNFTIGNTLKIGVYNPLGRTWTMTIVYADNTEQRVGSYSGTSVSGFTDNSWLPNWYASIPNAKSGTYKVKVTYGSNTDTRTGGTYTVNTTAAAPSIGGLTYEDTNTTVQALIGDTSKIVQNIGTVRYTATGLATKYSATIASVKVTVNNSTYTLTRSGTTATGGNAVINSSTNVTATATITDSRGLTATKSVTVQMLAWGTPSGTVTLARHSNFYPETDIAVNATVSSLDGKNTATITYRYKETSSDTWSAWASIQSGVTSTFTADNTAEWNVQVQIVDALGATTTINKVLGRGIPIMYFDVLRNSVAFNKFPESDNTLDVGFGRLVVASDSSGMLRLGRNDTNTHGDLYMAGTATPTLVHRLTDSSGTQKEVTRTRPDGFHPYTTKGANLGTSEYQWNNLYATTIYENGTSLENKYLTNTVWQDFKPTLDNCTVTYTRQWGRYKYIGPKALFGMVNIRGSITAVGSPAYSRINISSIPGLSDFTALFSFATLNEFQNANFTNTVSHACMVSNGTISIQQNGLTANNWKVGNNLYIAVAFALFL